jgi:hypothetical protein
LCTALTIGGVSELTPLSIVLQKLIVTDNKLPPHFVGRDILILRPQELIVGHVSEAHSHASTQFSIYVKFGLKNYSDENLKTYRYESSVDKAIRPF